MRIHPKQTSQNLPSSHSHDIRSLWRLTRGRSSIGNYVTRRVVPPCRSESPTLSRRRWRASGRECPSPRDARRRRLGRRRPVRYYHRRSRTGTCSRARVYGLTPTTAACSERTSCGRCWIVMYDVIGPLRSRTTSNNVLLYSILNSKNSTPTLLCKWFCKVQPTPFFLFCK